MLRNCFAHASKHNFHLLKSTNTIMYQSIIKINGLLNSKNLECTKKIVIKQGWQGHFINLNRLKNKNN